MKYTIILQLLFLSISSFGQVANSETNELFTMKYTGTYGFGSDIERGTIVIYPETDTTILFYIVLKRRTPSYNMGSVYGRATGLSDSGKFLTKFAYSDNKCKWTFRFLEGNLIIKTIADQFDCGFGEGIFPDGSFKRESSKLPEYFEGEGGNKIFFKITKPDNYYKD